MANIFTTAGEAFVADVIDSTVAQPANYFIGWGTGAGTAAKADTTLFTESAETRATATKTQPTASTNRFVGTLTAAGSSRTVTNAGVLTLVSTGTLMLKSDFTGLPIGVGDAIQFQFDIVWS